MGNRPIIQGCCNKSGVKIRHFDLEYLNVRSCYRKTFLKKTEKLF